MSGIFQTNNISYKYNKEYVLDKISLEIPKGSVTGIIGRNGSGKTTLIRLLSGFLRPSKGEIELNSIPLSRYSRRELAQKIAFLEQSTFLSLPFTVGKVVEMGRYPWLRTFLPLSGKDYKIIREALECFNIYDKKDEKVENLSGGERQLVSLARAMAQEPEILFLDEPTTYLDIGHQSMVMHHLAKWHKDWNTTIIMVIHDLNLASQYCDNLIILNQGKCLISGKPEEILDQELISETYKTDFSMVTHPVSGIPQFLPLFLDEEEKKF